jgi:hypothetical protein
MSLAQTREYLISELKSAANCIRRSSTNKRGYRAPNRTITYSIYGLGGVQRLTFSSVTLD